MEQKNSTPKAGIIMGGLLLLALLAGGYFWQQSRLLSSENKSLSESNEKLNENLKVLEDLRSGLLEDIESLQMNYDRLIESNDSLGLLFEGKSKEVDRKRKEIKTMKSSFAKDVSGMNAEIAQLKKIKAEMAVLVGQLKNENSQLKASNKNLEGLLAASESRNKELAFQISELEQMNADLEKEKSNLMATSARATNIRLDIRKRGDKPTGSSRRAKEISVSFDVKHLPSNKKGKQNIYVVVKNAKGVPVKVENPVKVIIKPDSGGTPEPIVAQQLLTAELFENKRLEFKVNPIPGSLAGGYYRVAIYTDWGLLGGAQFQLR